MLRLHGLVSSSVWGSYSKTIVILYFDVNKVLRQASHRKVCHSDSALGFRTVGVWMWIGIADRNSGKASGHGLPGLARIEDRWFRKSVVQVAEQFPTNIFPGTPVG